MVKKGRLHPLPTCWPPSGLEGHPPLAGWHSSSQKDCLKKMGDAPGKSQGRPPPPDNDVVGDPRQNVREQEAMDIPHHVADPI